MHTAAHATLHAHVWPAWHFTLHITHAWLTLHSRTFAHWTLHMAHCIAYAWPALHIAHCTRMARIAQQHIAHALLTLHIFHGMARVAQCTCMARTAHCTLHTHDSHCTLHFAYACTEARLRAHFQIAPLQNCAASKLPNLKARGGGKGLLKGIPQCK